MIVILADDLTGASDAAAQFAARGYATALRLQPGPPYEPVDVCSYTADNRHLSPQEAYEAARITVLPVADSLSHLFVKIDSTMRGPVLAHILGAMSVCHVGGVVPCQPGKAANSSNECSSRMAVVCPAYPEMGRQVIDQIVLVDGTPLAETAMADDPVTMVQNSKMAEMLGSVHSGGLEAYETQHLSENRGKEQVVALKSEGDWGETLGQALNDGVRVATVDAATREDLADLADGLAKYPEIVPVGSAGLAAECARIWAKDLSQTPESPSVVNPPHPGSPTVVLISSCHPASKAQLDSYLAHDHGRTVVVSPDLSTASDPDSLALWIDSADLRNADTVIVVRPEERTSNPVLAANLANILGAATATLARRILAGTLVLVGGDGAGATLKNLGITELTVNTPLDEGIGSAIAVDGFPGVLIVTKAGGFGGPEALTCMLDYCRKHVTRDQMGPCDKEVL